MRKIDVTKDKNFDDNRVYILNNNTCPYDIHKLAFCVQANTYFWPNIDNSGSSVADMTIYENIEDIINDYQTEVERSFWNIYEFENIEEFCKWYLEVISPQIDRELHC